MNTLDTLTWQDAVEVARFLWLPVVDLVRVPAKVIEEALVIIRARTNE